GELVGVLCPWCVSVSLTLRAGDGVSFWSFFFFSSRRRHTRSVSAFLLNRSSDLVASLPLIKERILVIILLLHFLSLMLGSVLVLMLPLLVWLTPDLRIKKSLLKCNWTIRKRLPRCKM